MREIITKYGMEYLKFEGYLSKDKLLKEYISNQYPNFVEDNYYSKKLGAFPDILQIYYKETKNNNIALELYSLEMKKSKHVSERNGKINLTLLNKNIQEAIEEIKTKKEQEKLDAKKEEFRNMQDYGHLVKEFSEFEFYNKKDWHGFLLLSGKTDISGKVDIFVSVADDRTVYIISIRAKDYLRTEIILNKEDTRKLLTTLKSLNFL